MSLFASQEIGSGLQVAQVVGLTSTAFLSGSIFTKTWSTTPALLAAPAALLAAQWKRQFDTDKWLASLVSVGAGSVFAWLAYKEPSSSVSFRLNSTSAALLFALFPYSFLLLHPINNNLEAKALQLAGTSLTDDEVETNVKREETVHVLVDRWATLNLGRAVLSGLAAGLGTWAALQGVGVSLATGANRMGN